MIVFTNMGASDDRLHASVCMARERPELIRMVMIVLNSSSIYKTLFFGEILQTSTPIFQSDRRALPLVAM